MISHLAIANIFSEVVCVCVCVRVCVFYAKTNILSRKYTDTPTHTHTSKHTAMDLTMARDDSCDALQISLKKSYSEAVGCSSICRLTNRHTHVQHMSYVLQHVNINRIGLPSVGALQDYLNALSVLI